MKTRIHVGRLFTVVLAAAVIICFIAVTATALHGSESVSFGVSNKPVWSGNSASSFESGNGTAETPYLISTGEQLKLLSSIVNGTTTQIGGTAIDKTAYNNPAVHYKLAADIALNDIFNYGAWNEAYEAKNVFTPIGTADNPFSAQFDGAGFTVSGLYVNQQSNAGLFGVIAGNSTAPVVVSNLNIVKSTVVGHNESAGSVAGLAKGKVELRNCFSSAKVISLLVTNNDALLGGGGIIGAMHGISQGTVPTVSDCMFSGRVEGRIPENPASNNNKNVGGIVGAMKPWSTSTDQPLIQNCVNKGEVEVNVLKGSYFLYVGGIVGHIRWGGSVVNSGNEASIRVTSNYNVVIGGVLGYANYWQNTLKTIWNTGDVFHVGQSAPKAVMGGLIGHMYVSSNELPVIQNLYNSGDLTESGATAQKMIGGLVGESNKVTGGTPVEFLKIENAVNEGILNWDRSMNAIIGAAIGSSVPTLMLNNFVNYNRTLTRYNSSEFRIAGEYKLSVSKLAGNNIMLPREPQTVDNTIYTEQDAEVFFISPTGVTHKGVDALGLLNMTSASLNMSKWADAGKRKLTDGTDYNYYLPQEFIDMFGSSGDAFDSNSPIYEVFEGKGTPEEPYLIKNAKGLSTLRQISNDSIYMGTTLNSEQRRAFLGPDVHYEMVADIYLNDVSDFAERTFDSPPRNVWTSISEFQGTFDGGGHTIYGLYTNSGTYGLFEGIDKSTVRDLNIDKALVRGTSILANNIAESSIENVRVSGEIKSGSTYSGGMATIVKNSRLSKCVSDVKITRVATSGVMLFTGGLIGTMEGGEKGGYGIFDCVFNGSITSSVYPRTLYVGGIVGKTEAGIVIENCVMNGRVQGNSITGGILGSGSNTRIIGCSTSPIAEIVSYGDSDNETLLGGIAGELSYDETDRYVMPSAVIGCVSEAQMQFQFADQTSTMTVKMGGIVGRLNPNSSVLNCRVTNSGSANMNFNVGTGATRKTFFAGGIVGITGDMYQGEIIIAGNVAATHIKTDTGITNTAKAYSGICGDITYADTKIFNNVVSEFTFNNDIDQLELRMIAQISSRESASSAIENNFVAASETTRTVRMCELNTGWKVINNFRYDKSSGKLVDDNGAFTTYRLDESRILVANIQEAINARAAEYNFPGDAALPPEQKTAFIRYDVGTQTVILQDKPMFYARYEVRRPDGVELIGGFFVSEGGYAPNLFTLNTQPIHYDGFVFNGWTFSADDGAIFDFSTPIDRNYTFKSSYVMQEPSIAPSGDIDIIYDGKSHEIALNPEVKHNLAAIRYNYTQEYPNGGISVSPLESPVYSFENVIYTELKHELSIKLTFTDAWGTYYSSSASHVFKVIIKKAPLTVTGLIAENRKYDTTTDVKIKGGELNGIKTNDLGLFDDVSVVSMPTAGKVADKNVGKDKPVSFDDIQLTGADAQNYEFTQPVLKTDISALQISLNGVAAVDRVYDGTTDVGISANGFNGVLAPDEISFDPTATQATVADKNAGVSKAVTVTKIALTGTDAKNYECVVPTGLKVNILPKELKIVGLTVSSAAKIYDSTRDVALSGGTLSGIIQGDSVSCVMPTTGLVPTKNQGDNKEVSVTAPALSGADRANYTVTIAGKLFVDIVKKDVYIKNVEAVDRIYNKTSMVAIRSDGLDGVIQGDDFKFAVPTSGTISEIYVGENKPVSISWGTAEGTDVGNYNIVLPELVTVNITPQPLSIDGVSATPRQYDGTLKVGLSAASARLNGVYQGDDIGFELPQYGLLDSADAGSDKRVSISNIKLTSKTQPSLLINYKITTQYITVDISPREISAVWDEVDSYVYNAEEQVPSAIASTGVNGEYAVLEVTGAQINVGDAYTAVAALTSVTNGKSDNYKLTGVNKRFAITARGVKVTINQTVEYVELTPWSNSVWNGNVSGLLAGHVFSGTVTTNNYEPTAYTSDQNEFIYTGIAINDASSVDVTANYLITYDLKVNITRGQILFTAKNYIGSYDGEAHSIDLNVTTEGITIEYSTDNVTFTSGLPPFVNAGEYTVYFRLSDVNHRYDTVDDSAKVQISPAPLRATLTAEGGVYNGNPIPATYIVSGNFGNVSVILSYTGITNGGQNHSDPASAPSLAGNYTVTATTNDTNYTLGQTSANFNIGRAETTIDVTGVKLDYIYNGAVQVVDSGAILNHQETDPVYSDNSFTNVGSGSYTVKISADQTPNYLAAEKTVVVTVAKARIDDASGGYEEVYDGKEHGITVSASGFFGADDMSLATVEYSLDGNNWGLEPIKVRYVADSKTVFYRITFDDYEEISGSKEIVISPKTLTIEGVEAATQEYDRSLIVKRIEGGKLVGTVAGDVVHPVVPTTAAMADKHAGVDKAVILDAITLDGANASNYTLTQPAVTVTVTPRKISVQGLRVISKIYDGTAEMGIDVQNAILFTLIDGDSLTISGATAEASDAAAGTGKEIKIKSITLAGDDKDNYSVAPPTGMSGTITPRALSFELIANGGIYNGNPIGATFEVSDCLAGDSGNVTLRYTGLSNGGSEYDSENSPYLAGTYTVTASFDNSNYSLDGVASKQFVIARAEAVIDPENVKTDYVYIGYPQIVNSGASLNHTESEIRYVDNLFTNVGTGTYIVKLYADQSDNYSEAYEEVTISVAKRAITVTLEESVLFTGAVWSQEVWEGHVSNLVTGHSFAAKVETANSTAGIYSSAEGGFVFSGVAITGENEEDLTANYEIVYDLTIVIKSASLTGENGVELTAPGGFNPGVELSAEEVLPDTYTGLTLDDKAIEILWAREISLINNGRPDSLPGSSTLRLLIDESLRGRDDLIVVFISEDGEIVNMNATREGDYMVFQTDHNSVYAIAAFKSDSNPQTLSVGAIAGIAIGLIVLIAVIVLIIILRKKKAGGSQPEDTQPDGPDTAQNGLEEMTEQNEAETQEGAAESADEAGCLTETEVDEKLETECETEATSDVQEDDAKVELECDTLSAAIEPIENAEGGESANEENVTDNQDGENAPNAPLQDNAVVFVPTEQSFEEALQTLSDEQKEFYEGLRTHALDKEGAAANRLQTGEAIKLGRKTIVRLSIRRATVVAAFSLEHPLLKQYKKQSGEDERDAIKVKPTEVFVSDAAAYNAAKDMIDIVVKQLTIEKEESKRRRAARPKKESGETPETETEK